MQFQKRTLTIFAAVLLLIAALWLISSVQLTRVEAGGSPQPMFEALKSYWNEGYKVTIYTRVPTLLGGNAYVVNLTPTGSDYDLTRIGTDVLCFQAATGDKTPVCVPFSSIDYFTYTK
jgi:hypothetical protein